MARSRPHGSGRQKRPNVLKLCRHIQDLPGAIVQYGDPEYNALACWVSDDEVKIAMKMKLRKHYTIDQLAKNDKMPKDKCKEIVGSRFWAWLDLRSTRRSNVPEGRWQVRQPAITSPFSSRASWRRWSITSNSSRLIRSSLSLSAEYTIKRIMPLAGNIPVGHGVMRVVPIRKRRWRSRSQRRRKD
jgi:hypothetical protein